MMITTGLLSLKDVATYAYLLSGFLRRSHTIEITFCLVLKSNGNGRWLQIFVAFSENLSFNISIITFIAIDVLFMSCNLQHCD